MTSQYSVHIRDDSAHTTQPALSSGFHVISHSSSVLYSKQDTTTAATDQKKKKKKKALTRESTGHINQAAHFMENNMYMTLSSAY